MLENTTPLQRIQYVSKDGKIVITPEKIKTKLCFMCEECFNLIKAELNFEADIRVTSNPSVEVETLVDMVHFAPMCPFCGYIDTMLIDIDYNIAEAISILNKKGFRTLFCCEGHEHGNGSDTPYIVFENPNIFKFTENNFPINWKIDFEFIRNQGIPEYGTEGSIATCIRGINDYKDGKWCNKEELMISILEFAKKLPDISKDYNSEWDGDIMCISHI